VAVAALVGANAQPHAAEAPQWELGLGVGGLQMPLYRGAQASRRWLLPVPYAVYRGEILRANREGVRALLLDTDRLDLDLSLAASPPARSADEPARQGMPDLAGLLEFGPNANWRLARGAGWKLEARLPLRAAFTIERAPRFVGWSSTPRLNLDWRVAGGNAGAQFGPVWGSRALHAYLYDVPPAYATATRSAYRAAGGGAGWQGTLSWSRSDGPRWAGVFLRADALTGARFADSPLVTRRHGLAFGGALSWSLWQSAQRVRDPEAEP